MIFPLESFSYPHIIRASHTQGITPNSTEIVLGSHSGTRAWSCGLATFLGIEFFQPNLIRDNTIQDKIHSFWSNWGLGLISVYTRNRIAKKWKTGDSENTRNNRKTDWQSLWLNFPMNFLRLHFRSGFPFSWELRPISSLDCL